MAVAEAMMVTSAVIAVLTKMMTTAAVAWATVQGSGGRGSNGRDDHDSRAHTQ